MIYSVRGISCAEGMFIGYSLSTHRKSAAVFMGAMEEDGDAPTSVPEAEKVSDIFAAVMVVGMDVR
jgi:hypothetical protein